MIEDFYTTQFTVYRDTWTGNTSSLASQGTFYGQLQQLDTRDAEFLGLTHTEAYTIWCGLNTDVEEGDVLTYDSQSYSVQAIHKYITGSNQHIQIIIQKDEQPASV